MSQSDDYHFVKWLFTLLKKENHPGAFQAIQEEFEAEIKDLTYQAFEDGEEQAKETVDEWHRP